MPKQIWKLIVEYILPLIWPIIRDSIIEIVQDIFTWFKDYLRDFLSKRASKQEDYAEKKAHEAEQKAATATTHDDRIKLEAEAAVWKQMSSELKSQNSDLQRQVDDLLAKASEYASSRVEGEATKVRAEQRVLSLPPPKETPNDKKLEIQNNNIPISSISDVAVNVVLLDPDVAQAFPTSDTVNDALRLLMQIAQRQTRKVV